MGDDDDYEEEGAARPGKKPRAPSDFMDTASVGLGSDYDADEDEDVRVDAARDKGKSVLRPVGQIGTTPRVTADRMSGSMQSSRSREAETALPSRGIVQELAKVRSACDEIPG